MSWFAGVSKLFGGGDNSPEALYQRGLKMAKAGDLAGALKTYTQVLEMQQTPPEIRAMCQLNRAQIHTSRRDNAHALEDLRAVLETKGAPAEVISVAKDKLTRLERRMGN